MAQILPYKNKLSDDIPDHANVVVLPPIVFLGTLLAGFILNRFFPLSIIFKSLVWGIFGWILFIFGLVIVLWSVKTMRLGGEHENIYKPTKSLITKGPFSLSRNPIYLAMLIGLFSFIFILNTYWLVIFFPIVYLLLLLGVIKREENYLQRKFGEKFRQYRLKVPRWL